MINSYQKVNIALQSFYLRFSHLLYLFTVYCQIHVSYTVFYYCSSSCKHFLLPVYFFLHQAVIGSC